MTILMSGVNMYAMAVVMQTVLGWNITFSIWVGAGTVALYVMLGGLRSAIINEVLQFVLIWAGAAMIPILGLIEADGWTNLKAQIAANVGNSQLHPHLDHPRELQGQPHGRPLDRHRLRPRLCRQLRLLDYRLPRRAARALGQQPARRQDGPGHRRRLQDGRAAHRDRSRPARARRAQNADGSAMPPRAASTSPRSPASTASTTSCR